MSDTLRRILADKAAHVAASRARVSLAELETRARAADPPRGFARTLRAKRAAGQYGLIAEIKKASPSRGLIRDDFDPALLAGAYAAGGAACLSVLTDIAYFQGDDRDLAAARAAVALPCLRKDFTIDAYQVAEARALGADCILLILAALSDVQAAELEAAAGHYGMDVLVEVHDAAERDRAVRLRSRMLGINNRDLKTLRVDTATAVELAAGIPADWLVVGESGLKTRADLDRLAAAGITSFLIGEALMLEADVAAATRRLVGLPT